MYYFELFFKLLPLVTNMSAGPSIHHEAMAARGWDVIYHINEAVNSDLVTKNPIFTSDSFGTAAEKTAALLLNISWHESGWIPGIVNKTGGDCGLMQVRNAGMWGTSCDAMKADPTLALLTGYKILMHTKKVCGGVAKDWLAAYASGRCKEGHDKALTLCSRVKGCNWK